MKLVSVFKGLSYDGSVLKFDDELADRTCWCCELNCEMIVSVAHMKIRHGIWWNTVDKGEKEVKEINYLHDGQELTALCSVLIRFTPFILCYLYVQDYWL